MTMYNDSMSQQGRPSNRKRSAFGQRLFEMREAAGLTQIEIAEQLGIGQRSYSAWERDTIAIQPERLKQLAKILDITVGELVGEAQPKRTTAPRGKLHQIFETASQLPRRQQNKVAEWVEAFVNQQAANTSS